VTSSTHTNTHTHTHTHTAEEGGIALGKRKKSEDKTAPFVTEKRHRLPRGNVPHLDTLRVSTRQIYTHTHTIDLPNLLVSPSTIPQAGLGVFADQPISKNTYITIYGGKYLSVKDAKKLDSRTHVRTIISQFSCIDADVTQNSFTRQDLVDRHMVGGFVNDPYNTKIKVNCKYDPIWCEVEGFPRIDNPVDHPSDMQSHTHTHATRLYELKLFKSLDHVMILATKDIEKGEELFASYGKDYWDLQQHQEEEVYYCLEL
jgi:hypothetical protein